MNAPVILDRRHVLKGGGALIISFSLTRAFAQDQTVPAAAPSRRCVPAERSVSTSRVRSSRVFTSRIWPRC